MNTPGTSQRVCGLRGGRRRPSASAHSRSRLPVAVREHSPPSPACPAPPFASPAVRAASVVAPASWTHRPAPAGNLSTISGVV